MGGRGGGRGKRRERRSSWWRKWICLSGRKQCLKEGGRREETKSGEKVEEEKQDKGEIKQQRKKKKWILGVFFIEGLKRREDAVEACNVFRSSCCVCTRD